MPSSPPNLLRVFNLPVIRALVIFVFSIYIAVRYCKSHYYRDPGGAFFDEKRAYVRWYTNYRHDQGEEFINTVDKLSGSSGLVKASTHTSVCATFITVKRDISEQYIENALGTFLDGMTAAERRDMSLNVFFAQTNPEAHPTWGKKWLKRIADEVYTYSDVKTSFDLNRVEEMEMKNKGAEKAVFDYITALLHCYENTRADYIAIFEDDVVFADSWFVRTKQALQEIEAQGSRWLYLRLFNQERSIGWAAGYVGGNNEHWISLTTASVVCAFLLLLRKRSRAIKRNVDNPTLALICFLAVPSFVILFFKIGKASLFSPKPGVRKEAFGCCSQGLVYPRAQAPALAEYLRQISGYKTDLVINSFSRTNHLDRFALYPVMMQHVGVSSAQATKAKEAQAVWSMSFEELNPKSLKKDHLRMVEQVYGADAAQEQL